MSRAKRPPLEAVPAPPTPWCAQCDEPATVMATYEGGARVAYCARHVPRAATRAPNVPDKAEEAAMPDDEPTAPLPPPPPGLSERHKAVWEALVADLRAVGLTEANRVRLEGVVRAIGRLEAIAERLERDGLMVTGSTGQERPNALLGEEFRLRAQVATELVSLGIATPNYPVRIGADGRLVR